jgi:DNA polymerase-3 subunit beta
MIKVLNSELQNALSILLPAVNSNMTLPILSNFLLEAEESGKVTLSATNLEVVAQTKFEAIEVSEKLAVTIPAVLFSRLIASRNKNAELKLKLNEDNMTLRVSIGRWWSKVNCLDANDYPLIPTLDEYKEGSTYHLNSLGSDFFSKASKVVPFAAKDDVRPVLGGVYFHVIDNNLYGVATDGFRLSRVRFQENETASPKSIVPTNFFAVAKNALLRTDKDAEVTLMLGKRAVMFNEHFTISSQLVDSEYPDYSPILQIDPASQIGIMKADIVKAVKTCMIYAKESSNTIVLEQDTDGEVKVTAQAASVGSCEENVEVISNEGEASLAIAVNGNFLLDILPTHSGELVKLDSWGKMQPLQIEDDDALWVIMPMHYGR